MSILQLTMTATSSRTSRNLNKKCDTSGLSRRHLHVYPVWYPIECQACMNTKFCLKGCCQSLVSILELQWLMLFSIDKYTLNAIRTWCWSTSMYVCVICVGKNYFITFELVVRPNCKFMFVVTLVNKLCIGKHWALRREVTCYVRLCLEIGWTSV